MKPRFKIVEADAAVLDRERSRVMQLLGPVVPQGLLYEVGSTAVQGVIGKQDLDFLVRVPLREFAEYRDKLDSILARNPDQLSNEIYQGYKIESEVDVAVQLTVIDGPHDTFLKFLEILRSDSRLVAEYNDLKRRFHGRSVDSYRQAKSDFVQRKLRTRRSVIDRNELGDGKFGRCRHAR